VGNFHAKRCSYVLTCNPVFGFNVGFYALPFSEAVGFDASFGTLAAINLATLILVASLVIWGGRIREKQGAPKEHQDL